MKTYSFIGSDKNAGKTTAFNYLYRQLCQRDPGGRSICVTSIGINGEPVDSYENEEKPAIKIYRNSLFITAGEHVRGLAGLYAVHATFSGSLFSKVYILATALTDFNAVLEGPNEKSAIQLMKKTLRQTCQELICLIDGSIDRQFLGHPSISDGICFALLVSERREQLKKASDLLHALMLEACPPKLKTMIAGKRFDTSKSLLYDTKEEIIYHSDKVPFLDDQLKAECLRARDKHTLLYLNGALSRSLYDFLAPFGKLTIVLDNYTCYQNVSVGRDDNKTFKPRLFTYHSVPLSCLFLKQEGSAQMIRFPGNVPVCNLFRDEYHEIGI